MTFIEFIEKSNLPMLRNRVNNVKHRDVEAALSQSPLTFSGFLALISPTARAYLEIMAQKAHEITLQRFGRIILLYAPLYLSNECTNACVYCGFNVHRKPTRITLSLDEILSEAEYLKNSGFGHILLV